MRVVILPEHCNNYKRKDANKSAFDCCKSYTVQHFESFSESGSGFVILVNDEGEIWWINNQHVREVGVLERKTGKAFAIGI
ncbi:MAG: hypothetical protein SGJ04_05465 [Bacteroidota bacterium]|nr:hypothetical protein [Bacteroidota bacterium]